MREPALAKEQSMYGICWSRLSLPTAPPLRGLTFFVLALPVVAVLTFATPRPAAAQGQPVKIGELNSYSRMAVFSVPYRNGMQLGQHEINAKGGVLGGRKMEIVFRDDGATPGDAVRVAEDLLTRENVAFLAGT